VLIELLSKKVKKVKNNHKLGTSYKERILAHPGIFLEGLRGTAKKLTFIIVGILVDADM
jgi:hypothetical protein